MRASEFVQEGVNDPAIFKVVFVIGGPGSGKSYVSERLGLKAMGFVTINSDVAFEYMMQKHDIDPKMPPEEKEKRDVVRARAKEITAKKSDLAIDGRLGIHIDGTGDDYDKIANLKRNFEVLGYDAYLVVVNTKLDVARKRNQMRARTVPDKIVTNSWYDVQDNIGRFANIFSYISIIDNSGDAKATEEQINNTHVKLKAFVAEKPNKPAAKQWIAKQKKLDENWSDNNIVAFHGTTSDINNFNSLSHFGSMDAAKDRMSYKKFKNGKIYKVKLDIKNPLVIKDFPGIHYDRLYAFELKNKKLISQEEMEDITFTQDKIELRKKLLNKLKELGIDGFVYKNRYEDKGSTSYVITSPNQVKVLDVEQIDKLNNEASYPGNLGAMEMFKFKQMASPKLWELMKKLIAAGKEEEAWALLQKVTKTKLH